MENPNLIFDKIHDLRLFRDLRILHKLNHQQNDAVLKPSHLPPLPRSRVYKIHLFSCLGGRQVGSSIKNVTPSGKMGKER